MTLLTLRGGSSALIVDLSAPVPAVVHWGRDLGTDPTIPLGLGNPIPHSNYDAPFTLELFPQASGGWRGRPAISGHRRDGRGFSPAFVTTGHTQDGADAAIMMVAAAEQLSLTIRLSMSQEGMLRIRHELTNERLLPQNIMELVKRYSAKVGIPEIAPHDLRRTFAKLAHKGRSGVEQIQLSLGHSSLLTTEQYLGVQQDLTDAPCDHLGLRLE